MKLNQCYDSPRCESIIVSTTILCSSISVIAEMEAEIKHSEHTGCVEAELSYWVVDLQTFTSRLGNRVLDNDLKERRIGIAWYCCYICNGYLFCLLPLLLGKLVFLLHPTHVLLVVATVIVPYFPPTEMSICPMGTRVVHPLGHRDSLKKAVRVGTMTPSELIYNGAEEKASSTSTLVLVWKLWSWIVTVSMIFWLMKEPIHGGEVEWGWCLKKSKVEPGKTRCWLCWVSAPGTWGLRSCPGFYSTYSSWGSVQAIEYFSPLNLPFFALRCGNGPGLCRLHLTFTSWLDVKLWQ